MKKTIEYSKLNKELIALKFKYVNEALFYYTINSNDLFYFGVEEVDFRLDGYQIRLIKDLEGLEIVDNFSSKINKFEELPKKIKDFNINLTDFKALFKSLKTLNKIISVEREYYDEDNFFLIGIIVDVEDDLLVFKNFDINGKFSDELNYIPYDLITTIRFNSYYTNTWEKYLL